VETILFILMLHGNFSILTSDGFVKSHSAVLHFIFRHCGVLNVRLISQDSCALHNELFTLPFSILTYDRFVKTIFSRSTQSTEINTEILNGYSLRL